MIVVDSREQKPYWTGKGVMKTFLEVGDYTTIELLDVFHIERKSMEDLYGSLIQGHVRFMKEFIRARAHDIKLAVFIEGTHKAFINKDFPGGAYRKAPGETLRKMIETINERYHVDFIWCGNRNRAKSMVADRLALEARRNKRGKNAKSRGRTSK